VDGASLVQEVLETARVWWPKGYVDWMPGCIIAVVVGVRIIMWRVGEACMHVRLIGKAAGDQQLDAR
jgi:hypothetical protein